MQKSIYFFLIVLFFPIFIFAAEDSFIRGAGFSIFDNIINGIVGFLSTLFLAGGVIAMLYAGYMFFDSGGEPEKVTTARRNFFWGVIGLLVGLSAYAAPGLIKIFLQQQ